MYPKTVQYIEKLINDSIIPGVVYGFVKGNKMSQHALGKRQLTPIVKPMTTDTVFDIASLTKVVGTTSIILHLLEQGKIKLSDTLRTHLPKFQDKYVTVEQLLTHSSGINSYIPNRHSLNKQELIEAFYKLKSNPNLRGQEILYTDTGTILLGLMIEEIYQQPVQKVIMDEVIQPLGMTNTSFSPLGGHIAPTEYTKERGLIMGEVHDPKAFVLQEHAGSAGLFSNLNDLFRFSFMLMSRGKIRPNQTFLKNETIENLLHSYIEQGEKSRSLGWDIIKHPVDQHPLLYHTGYTGTFMLIDIPRQEAFIFLSNRVHPIDHRDDYLAHRDKLIAIYLEELVQENDK